MRVLFVLKQIDYEPIGIMQLSSVLKAAGHEVRLAVVATEDVARTVREWQPQVLAYSVWTGGHRYYLELNRRLREEVRAFSVFGGPHATFFPEMIEEDDLVDGLCVGEGEGALADLVNTLEAGADYTQLPNWRFRVHRAGGTEIVCNPVRTIIRDLNSLPAPDRALIYAADPVNRDSPIKHFITGRGCPYDCSYCFNHAWAEIYIHDGHRVRRRSVDLVLDEIEEVRKRWRLAFVVFLDDTFTLQKGWMSEFVEKYPRRIGLPFFCNVRANLVTPALAAQLRACGCVTVGMGIETADDALRNEILKRNMSREQITHACRVLRDAGLAVLTTNMIGLPGGNLALDLETVKLNAECRPAFANAFLFQPYPKTELGEFAAVNGYLAGNLEDIGLSAWNETILKFPPGEKRQIENLQKLFAISVEFPALLPLTRALLKLPPNPVFWLIHKLWKGYTIKARVHPVTFTWRDYMTIVRRYMKLE